MRVMTRVPTMVMIGCDDEGDAEGDDEGGVAGLSQRFAVRLRQARFTLASRDSFPSFQHIH